VGIAIVRSMVLVSGYSVKPISALFLAEGLTNAALLKASWT